MPLPIASELQVPWSMTLRFMAGRLKWSSGTLPVCPTPLVKDLPHTEKSVNALTGVHFEVLFMAQDTYMPPVPVNVLVVHVYWSTDSTEGCTGCQISYWYWGKYVSIFVSDRIYRFDA